MYSFEKCVCVVKNEGYRAKLGNPFFSFPPENSGLSSIGVIGAVEWYSCHFKAQSTKVHCDIIC